MVMRAHGVTLASSPLRSSNPLYQSVTGNTNVQRVQPVIRHGRTEGMLGSMNGLVKTALTSSLSLHSDSLTSSVQHRGKPRGFKESGRVRTHVITASSAAPKVREGDKAIATGDRRPSGGKQTKHRLVMMRHSSSVSVAPGVKDHDRPLTQEGKNIAAQCASRLRDLDWLPELILCSDSMRTKETLDTMIEVEPSFGTAEIHFLPSLYTVAALDGQTRNHLQAALLERVSESTTCVMCMGHNKGWEEAASDLSGTTIELKTGEAALLEMLGESWEDAMEERQRHWAVQDIIRQERSPL
mmetsp:Transcript_22152/g.48617  ORF Transcript_22152/g.48617 Transcript_22152/m.48617 type:complete len:298 (-) Transcript_22152:171-1064(-)|eukprot:CAMPEP_0118935624 /NCGR_PEP_ID=MMETSP1169-20130426/15745_1 /TAXON_ID=36882 /ORGANISM="Pyramimonas obovata, Strain CCMP722" /LENGTH=297 /DNA_ID=CAMNT_0006878681 /DNA_START=121 /DNA_END=1014 /DNA_ORIENTATION=-